MTDEEQLDAVTLADSIERVLRALPEDNGSAADRMLRARLEGYIAGLRSQVPHLVLRADYGELGGQ